MMASSTASPVEPFIPVGHEERFTAETPEVMNRNFSNAFSYSRDI